MQKQLSAELVEQANTILEAGHTLLDRTHARALVDRLPLVNRLTVAKGYLELLESCPDDIDCAGKLREALTDLQGIMQEHAAHTPRGR